MKGHFAFTLDDFLGHPVLNLTGKLLKLVVKALFSAGEKADNENMATTELSDLIRQAHSGDANAQLLLGVHYAENNSLDEATYWILKSAAQGNEYALEIVDMFQEE
ncbi:MAG: hypothetical protein FWE11_01720 [Defluviitaleaceae bacterium]|nr:hypothetical protein [Defluviitaleaceae bacterium]